MDIHRVAVKISKKAEYFILKDHPWIYSDSIEKISDDAKNGDMAIIYSKKSNKLLAVGFIDIDSNIRIRVFSVKKKLNDFKEHLKSKINKALKSRKAYIDSDTNSYRLIYGENDDLPGLIIDNYDNNLVVKLYSSLWLPYVHLIQEILTETFEPNSIYIRYNRKLLEKYSHLQDHALTPINGLENYTVLIKENGIKYEVNLLKGHKTGYFLDHRYNRKEIRQYSEDKDVLDVFSYAGGFGLNGLYGGAKSITCIDINPKAISQIKRNLLLNEMRLSSATLIAKDAQKAMQELISKRKRFDLVIIDPPSYSKDSKNKAIALKNYANLFKMGSKLLANDGVLVMASCSSKITIEDLKSVYLPLANQNKLRIIKETSHDFDHPHGITELDYLKTLYFQ